METIHKLIYGNSDDFKIIYRIHATRRIFQRSINPNDVVATLFQGKIIENYGDDFPLPSVLISGRTEKGNPLHVVAAINHEEQQLIIITAYNPDPNLWSEDYTRRL
ncbi:MAG: DUF4258 domain-containing protein [Desulfosalsimonas sp.]|uniref:DUF4258 domain-containing protein n=1 Tax=Desulfosalsimonas sp. TaxID=3073848 RepID=UPI0039711712